MSLKDRLNSVANKQNTIIEEIKQQPKYYESSEMANNIDSLGVIDALFADDELNAIYISGAKNIYIEKKGKLHKSTTTYRDNVQLENLIKKYAQNIGIEINEQKPHITFNHKEGINVTATLPPLSNVATMFIKCYKDKFATLQNLQENQSVSKEIALILEALATIKCNIIIAGEKNTLKTTVLSSIGKKLPSNNRGVVIDNCEEFKMQTSNYTNFNLSNLENNENKFAILNAIINSNPDKLLFNDCDSKTLSYLIQKALNGYSGLITTIEAINPTSAMENIAQSILLEKPFVNPEIAKGMAHKAFDVLIFTTRDEFGRRKISSISQINIDSNGECMLLDIFKINHLGEFQSTGFVPEFFEIVKLNSLPISSNIFDSEYKHTYHQSYKNDALNQFAKKGAGIDILKKFKKDLPTQDLSKETETQENLAEENIPETIELELNEEEIIKKAQEKFEELKRNSQIEQTEQQSENESIEIIKPLEDSNEQLY